MNRVDEWKAHNNAKVSHFHNPPVTERNRHGGLCNPSEKKRKTHPSLCFSAPAQHNTLDRRTVIGDFISQDRVMARYPCVCVFVCGYFFCTNLTISKYSFSFPFSPFSQYYMMCRFFRQRGSKPTYTHLWLNFLLINKIQWSHPGKHILHIFTKLNQTKISSRILAPILPASSTEQQHEAARGKHFQNLGIMWCDTAACKRDGRKNEQNKTSPGTLQHPHKQPPSHTRAQ